MFSAHIKLLRQKLIEKATDYKLLVQCFLVALSLHVILLPVLWVIGWALPWPKNPVITTIIEYELDNSSLTLKPKHVIDFHDPKLNQ